MDFKFTPEQDRFREEIRSFLQREITPKKRAQIESGEEDAHYDKAFSKKVSERGWIGLSWPKEWGGQGIGHIDRCIYNEEMTVAEAPVGHHFMAERQMGPSIMMHGTPEQCQEYIPGIVAGELSFCIGYSEPGAGSDLASLQTRAQADGDDYVINGQKMYTSGAHVADYIWLAARTDPEAPKHKGVSVFLVDMKSPGVTVRPLISMDDAHSFNEVFFDQVRVPKTTMVGEENRGWYVVASNLDFERSGIERVAGTRRVYLELEDFVRRQGAPGVSGAVKDILRHRLAEMAVEYHVGRLLTYRVAWLQSRDIVPNYEASMSKVYGCEVSQRVAKACVDILGLFGALRGEDGRTPLKGRVARSYLRSISSTIAGGSSEIQRNIIATRGLGLPR